jgi:hypothetical protein
MDERSSRQLIEEDPAMLPAAEKGANASDKGAAPADKGADVPTPPGAIDNPPNKG